MATNLSNQYRSTRSILSCLGCPGQSQKVSPIPALSQQPNRTPDEWKETEEFLQSEFSKLSLRERSKALDDLNCYGENLEESPASIAKSLAEFEKQLQDGNYPIYEVAVNQNRAYVEDPSFRLKFLRAQMYDVTGSVKQMVKFLGQKAMYFGAEKIARDITLHDLNEEELDLMLCGMYHIAEDTDKQGRVILYSFSSKMKNCTAGVMNRMNYYFFFNILISMPAVQKKGLVAVSYDSAKPGEKVEMPSMSASLAGFEFMSSLPIRFSAIHLCQKTGSGTAMLNNFFLGLALKSISQYSRARATIHYGSDMELLYQLRNHGLRETFPIDASGNVRWGILNVWFHMHMANEPSCVDTFNRIMVQQEEDSQDEYIEDTEEDTSENDREDSRTKGAHPLVANVVAESKSYDQDSTRNQPNYVARVPLEQVPNQPSDRDVFLGRGKDIQNHPGNIRFRQFLARYQGDYDAAPRHKRGAMAAELTQSLKAQGVRFFQRSGSSEWEDSNVEVVEKKVSQLLREFRKQRRKAV